MKRIKKHAGIVALLAVALIGIVGSNLLYGQGTVKANEVRVIDNGTDSEIVLVDTDGGEPGYGVKWIKSSDLVEVYTGFSSGFTDMSFISGTATWMHIINPGTSNASPAFDNGFQADGQFLATAGGTFSGRILSVVADAVDAYAVESGDSNKTWDIMGDTVTCWGDPTCDTNLYRSAANVLKTDDALHVAGLLVPLAGGGTDPAATCTPYELYLDTDGSTTAVNCTGGSAGVARLCGCTATDTWTGL